MAGKSLPNEKGVLQVETHCEGTSPHLKTMFAWEPYLHFLSLNHEMKSHSLEDAL